MKQAAYVSTFESFMDEFMKRHPDVVADQQRGWYIWWDHRLDLDELEKEQAAEVPAKPYTYE